MLQNHTVHQHVSGLGLHEFEEGGRRRGLNPQLLSWEAVPTPELPLRPAPARCGCAKVAHNGRRAHTLLSATAVKTCQQPLPASCCWQDPRRASTPVPTPPGPTSCPLSWTLPHGVPCSWTGYGSTTSRTGTGTTRGSPWPAVGLSRVRQAQLVGHRARKLLGSSGTEQRLGVCLNRCKDTASPTPEKEE